MRNQKRNNKVFILVVGLILIFLFPSLAAADVFTDNNESDFNQGSYSNTEWNTDHVELSSGYSSGTFESRIFNAGSEWNNISWHSCRPLTESIIDYFNDNESKNYYSQCQYSVRHWFNVSNIQNFSQITVYGVYDCDGSCTGSVEIRIGNTADWTDYILVNASDVRNDGTTTNYTWYNNTFNVSKDVLGDYFFVQNLMFAGNGTIKFLMDEAGPAGPDSEFRTGNNSDGSQAGWNDDNGDYAISIKIAGRTSLNPAIRSCDDSSCDGEIFTDILDESPQELAIANNTHFQYKFAFETDDAGYSPELYDVTIGHTPSTPNNAPQIILNAPENGSSSDEIYRLLDATVTDANHDLMTVCFYGSHDLSSNYVLLDTQANIANGDVVFNWTGGIDELDVGDDMVLLYHMDEANGTMVDYSGQGNNGTNNGADYGADGRFNTGLDFESIENDYIDSSVLQMSGAETFTLEAWIKAESFPNDWPCIISHDNWDGSIFLVKSGNHAGVQTGSSWVPGSAVIQTGKWHYIAATYNSTYVSLYIDGDFDNGYAYSSPLSSTSMIRIGQATGGSYSFDGIIDEAVIRNRSLSAEEIQEHYRLKYGKYYWYADADDGENTTQSDIWQFILSPPDTASPLIISTSPSNNAELSAGTESYIIKLITDETSVCRYNISDICWEHMTELTNTNSTEHDFTVSGLSDGDSYDYYFICEDSYGNRMNASHHLQFSTAESSGRKRYREDEIIIPECREEWDCSSWSECVDGMQDRECTDISDCNTIEDRPMETRACITAGEISADEETSHQSGQITSSKENKISGLSMAEIGGNTINMRSYQKPENYYIVSAFFLVVTLITMVVRKTSPPKLKMKHKSAGKAGCRKHTRHEIIHKLKEIYTKSN